MADSVSLGLASGRDGKLAEGEPSELADPIVGASGPGGFDPVFRSLNENNYSFCYLIVLVKRTKMGRFQPMPGTTKPADSFMECLRKAMG